jgi:hypothetical protein
VTTAKDITGLAVLLGTCKILSALHSKSLDLSCSAIKRNPRAKKAVGLGKSRIICIFMMSKERIQPLLR